MLNNSRLGELDIFLPIHDIIKSIERDVTAMTIIIIIIALVGFGLYMWNTSNIDQILSFWIDKDKKE